MTIHIDRHHAGGEEQHAEVGSQCDTAMQEKRGDSKDEVSSTTTMNGYEKVKAAGFKFFPKRSMNETHDEKRQTPKRQTKEIRNFVMRELLLFQESSDSTEQSVHSEERKIERLFIFAPFGGTVVMNFQAGTPRLEDGVLPRVAFSSTKGLLAGTHFAV